MSTTIDFVVCSRCQHCCESHHNFCPFCGSPLYDAQMNSSDDSYFAGNGYRSDFGWHRGDPPRPGDPGFESFWADHRIARDDPSEIISTLIVGATIAFSIYGVVKALRSAQDNGLIERS